MNKKINKLLYIVMLLLIVAMGSAAVLQLFFPEFLGSTAEYGLNAGWQREIGVWNLGLIAIMIGTLIWGDTRTVSIVALGGMVLPIGFGLNHLLAYFRNTDMFMSLFGALENFLFAGLLLAGLVLQRRKDRNEKSVHTSC